MLVATLKLVTVLGLALPGALPTQPQVQGERTVRLLKSCREMLDETEATRREVELQNNVDSSDRIQMLRTMEEHLKTQIKGLESDLAKRPSVMPVCPAPRAKPPVRD